MKGNLTFVLHSHIPYVCKKGKFPFGEEWVYEAIIECYLPLLKIFKRCEEKKLATGVTLGLTPVLIEQLKDPYMITEFIGYIKDRIQFSKNNCEKFSAQNRTEEELLAKKHRANLEDLLDFYTLDLEKDLISAFKSLQDNGTIEIITSAFTHGYLPLLKRKESVKLQLQLGVDSYIKNFGREPAGIWLPECAYKPGIDALLKEVGLKYFLTDAHAIIGGKASGISSYGGELSKPFSPKRPNTTFEPYSLKSGVSVLARNITTGAQVWSAGLGYPGEPSYREFHKRDEDSGLQYWAITDKNTELHQREIYNPTTASNKVIEHAHHFESLLENLLENYAAEEGSNGVILNSFDTELFGHWWHEGLEWLENTIEIINQNKNIQLATVKEYLANKNTLNTIDLPESSWGAGGKHEVWLNEDNKWVWDLIHQAEDAFWAKERSDLNFENPLVKELLLLQSSDWPFLMTTGQARKYSKKRIMEHWQNFNTLLNV